MIIISRFLNESEVKREFFCRAHVVMQAGMGDERFFSLLLLLLLPLLSCFQLAPDLLIM